MLVQALQDATLQCLREQRELFGRDIRERQDNLHRFADNLIDTHWHPDELSQEDVGHIEPWVITSIVLNTANGLPLGGYEAHIHERFTRLQAGETLPEVPVNPYRSGIYSGRRAYPRRRVP